MNGLTPRIQKLIEANTKAVSVLLAFVMLFNVVNVVRRATPAGNTRAAAGGNPNLVGPGAIASKSAAAKAAAAAKRNGGPAVVTTGPGGVIGKPGQYIPGVGTIPFGLNGNKIKLVYYWAGDRTGSSQYLGATGQKGAVDEGDAFERFVAYINKHANGGATFMGFPFNLHGRKLEYKIIDAGKYGEGYDVVAGEIKDIKPFAAISSHGGMSSFVCPQLAKAKIFNPVTYNLDWNLVKQTNGYCLPQGLSFDKQVQLTISYLKNQMKTPYQSASGPVARSYGILYASYPGTERSIPRLKQELLAAGIPLNPKSVYSVPVGLTDAGQASPKVADKFKADGVNTIIAPDSGSLITFTHGAEGRTYFPDYYVWPCSGSDAAGQVRLYDPHQWSRAKGLSCYDDHWNLDLTLDDNARKTQWFKQYREIAGGDQDPPATSPLVYEGLLPVLAGITNAGRTLTVERFFKGIDDFKAYRYHAIDGPTTNPAYFDVCVGAADGSQIGDVAEVTWDNTKTTAGNATAGTYVYSQKRYKPGAVFS